MLDDVKSSKTGFCYSDNVFTDLEKISYKDIFINGGALFIKQHNQRFAYGFGAALTNAFGPPMVLPGLYVQWNTGKRFKVEIVVPEKIKVSHKMSDYFETAVVRKSLWRPFTVNKNV